MWSDIVTIPYSGGNRIGDQYFICHSSDSVWSRNNMGVEKRTFRECDTYCFLYFGNSCISSYGKRRWKFSSEELCKSDNGIVLATSDSHDLQTYEIFDRYLPVGSGNSSRQAGGQVGWCGVRSYRSNFCSVALLFAYWSI